MHSIKISVDLHHNGQNSFYSSLKKMTDYHNLPGFNCHLLNECKIKQYVEKEICVLMESYPSTFTKTFKFCYKIKTNYNPPPPPAYIDLTRKNPQENLSETENKQSQT